jgi:hypothetical protein
MKQRPKSAPARLTDNAEMGQQMVHQQHADNSVMLEQLAQHQQPLPQNQAPLLQMVAQQGGSHHSQASGQLPGSNGSMHSELSGLYHMQGVQDLGSTPAASLHSSGSLSTGSGGGA